jgi:hypothetical protein
MRNTVLRGSLVLALGLFTGLLGASRQSRAEDVTVSVLGLEPAGGAPEAVATAVTEALRQRVSATSGYRLAPGRDLVEVKLVFSCPDEAPPCMTQAAQSIGAAKLIFGNLQPVGTDAYLVTLKLLDADRGVVEGWSSEQLAKSQSAPTALRAPAQRCFAALTGQTAPGAIKVTGGVIGAGVWLDGVQVGLLGADGLLLSGIPAGPHEIVVSKAGYEKLDRRATVSAGATEKVAVELKPIEKPGEATTGTPAGPEEPASHPGLTETTTPPPNQVDKIAAWALLGVGLVGVGLGAYSSYQVSVVNKNLDPYRRFACVSGGGEACSADGKTFVGLRDADMQAYVNNQKDTGEMYTKIQWVGYGLGGALIVTSAVFFYRGYFVAPTTTASRRKPSDLVVMPSFGPGSAGAVAYLHF